MLKIISKTFLLCCVSLILVASSSSSVFAWKWNGDTTPTASYVKGIDVISDSNGDVFYVYLQADVLNTNPSCSPKDLLMIDIATITDTEAEMINLIKLAHLNKEKILFGIEDTCTTVGTAGIFEITAVSTWGGQ